MPNPRVFFDVDIDGRRIGRIIMELFADEVPRTAENFRALCTGEAGLGKTSNTPLHFKGSIFHRVIKGFMIQGGDFTRRNGTGGESIYGGTFADESFRRKHDTHGLLSMANRGPNTNSSQFFITVRPTPHLDGKHVAFGRVVSGFEQVVEVIENTPVDGNDKPVGIVMISNCGELELRLPPNVKVKTRNGHALTGRASDEDDSEASARKKKATKESESESSSDSEEERRRRKKRKSKKKKHHRKQSRKERDDSADSESEDESRGRRKTRSRRRTASPSQSRSRSPRRSRSRSASRDPSSRSNSPPSKRSRSPKNPRTGSEDEKDRSRSRERSKRSRDPTKRRAHRSQSGSRSRSRSGSPSASHSRRGSHSRRRSPSRSRSRSQSPRRNYSRRSNDYNRKYERNRYDHYAPNNNRQDRFGYVDRDSEPASSEVKYKGRGRMKYRPGW
ncbi:hypothetical protein K493DRAFT_85416 [Basidiobolus meristosporus CBS 931.73]|uniref:peptidylprolyl isomerase n=1 Tax=Basidiobolus meristosporus CBS 931.73 TaxID=1314790 RepID=A0A1Y1XHW4_9FUNG|nr:hypothetical protein K493DRAFT_85416 [Basidiobolus meristosporus CBS 931.73]|eukprot:ORX85371.1 hypothetical protein K493DRAFT_85416 [Basidiobolus meristosporus CBS 931.73]